MTRAFPPPLILRGVRFDPPLFCAPMAAGITHSAFRRLLADFGGYGALFTEDVVRAHRLGRGYPTVTVAQTAPRGGPLDLSTAGHHPGPTAGNPRAPRAARSRRHRSQYRLRGPQGASTTRGRCDLFDDPDRLRDIVRTLRAHVAGPLTVKIRLGRRDPAWRKRLSERLRLLVDEGVDALTVHPRFSDEKLNRVPRHELYAELAAETRLPIIANADITGVDDWRRRMRDYAPVAGLMIGRMAAVRPWVFAQWHDPPLAVDPAAVWMRLFDYILEDFPQAGQALARIKIFTSYFARNFIFGHTLFVAVQSSPDLDTARARAAQFFAGSPALARFPSIDGI